MRIGTDIVEVGRIRKLSMRGTFVKRVFTEEEREYFATKKDPSPTIAANFAAKEAFSKALGLGTNNFDVTDISVLRNELGAPYFKLSGKAKQIIDELNVEISLTLSHSREDAVAFVVLEDKK